MPLSINTNISSLTAQRAIADSKSDLETAMERLSTGSKINSASDDAAGLAMAQRMTAQIKGLNMAVKNSSDGIAMTKSIEGAITEVSDMLQRMRELSVQAANGTNSASDRTYLQDEVNLLIQEINRISANTRYNGSLVLDGTFINKQLQVGVEEGEHISLSVDSIAANQVGAHTLIGNGMNPQDPAAQPPGNPVTVAEDIEIFGYIGTKVIEASAGDSAKDTAVKVNLSTADTGVRAYANTYAALSSSDEQSRTYNLKINGYQTGNFVISSNNVRDAVESINRISGASGVTASAQNNKVVLFDSDGDDITIENTKAGDEFVDLVVEKLGQDGDVYNVIGAPVTLAQGSTSQVSGVQAVYNASAGTLANYSGDTVIGDGTNSITITHATPPADLDALVTAIQAATGYSDLLFEVSANSDGTSLDFTYKTAGAITTAPTFTQAGAADEAGDTPDIYNASAGTLANYSGDTVIGDGTNSITVSHLAPPADLDALVTAIQGATGYSDLLFSVSANADGTSLDFTYKTPGTVSTAPTFTQAGANDEAGGTPAIYNIAVGTLANYDGDTVLSDGTNSVTIAHTGATIGAAVAEVENIQIRGAASFAGTTTLSDGTSSVTLDHSTTSPTDLADLISGLQGVNAAVAEVKGLTLGTVASYNGDFVLSDGTESITLDFSAAGSAPGTVAALVTAIQAHTNYSNLAFTVAADTAGTGLALTASTAGSAGTSPTLTYVEGGASQTSTVSTITSGSDTYADLDFTIAIGSDGVSIDATAGTAGATGISATLTSSSGGTVSAATVGTAGKDAMDLATLVTQIQSDAGYSSLAFTVAAGSDGSSLDLTYKADGAQTTAPTLDNATAVDEGTASVTQAGANGGVTSTQTGAQGAVAETTAGVDAVVNAGDTDTSRVMGTMMLSSSKAFSMTQSGTDANNYFSQSGQFATLSSVSALSLATQVGAQSAIAVLDSAIEKVSSMRAELGAIENRMDHTVSNLMNLSENTAAARSRIEDADFSVESANLAKSQVLTQAGTAMLAQANAAPQLVLQLLQ